MFLVMSAIASGCQGWLDIEEFANEHLDCYVNTVHSTQASLHDTQLLGIAKVVNVDSLVLVMFG